MKKLLFTTLLNLLAIYSFSQIADERVSNFFGQEKVDQWLKSAPDSVKFYNFVAEYSFRVVDENHAKYLKTPPKFIDLTASEIKILLEKPKMFDIFQSNVNWKDENSSCYVIPNSNKLLKINSYRYLVNKFWNK